MQVRSSSRVPTWVLLVIATVAIAGCKKRGDESGTAAHSGATPAADTSEIVVGAYLSMTGSLADFGINTKRGIDIAVEEVNARGGIRGRRVKVVVLDDQGKADEAGTAVTRLIDVENAVALLGEVASSLSLVGGRIAERRGIPMVSPSSTNTQVTAIGPNVFRVCFVDPFQGFVMAKFARENLRIDRVAIFRDVRNDYSIGLADAFKEAFTRLGGTIAAEQSYNQGDTDFSAQLTAMKGANAQALFVPGYYGDVGNIARQSRRLGLTVPLLGGDGWDSPQLHEIGGADIVGSYYSNHFAPDNPTPRSRAFIEAFRREFNETPSGLAALGYDAAAVLFDAMSRAPDFAPASIRTALAATRGFDGVTGVITMDENRNPVKPAVVVRVTAEGDRFEAQIAPEGASPSTPAAPPAPVAPAEPAVPPAPQAP